MGYFSTTVHSTIPILFPLLSAVPQRLCDLQRSDAMIGLELILQNNRMTHVVSSHSLLTSSGDCRPVQVQGHGDSHKS